MPKKIALKGFEEPDYEIQKRLVVSIDGHNQGGKTHLALTAPDPIALINFDDGLEGVIHKFKDKQIVVKNMEHPPDGAEGNNAYWQRAVTQFKSAYFKALQTPAIRTIIIDTGTELWEVLRLARLGKLSQVMPTQYIAVNAEMQQLVRTAYSYSKNLIILHKFKQVYEGNNWNGEYTRAGFSGMGYAVQVCIEAFYEDGEFGLRIYDKCRHNPTLAEGLELYGDMCNFETLMETVLES